MDNKSLLVIVGIGVGISLGFFFNSVIVGFIGLCLGVGFGLAVGTSLTSRDKSDPDD